MQPCVMELEADDTCLNPTINTNRGIVGYGWFCRAKRIFDPSALSPLLRAINRFVLCQCSWSQEEGTLERMSPEDHHSVLWGGGFTKDHKLVFFCQLYYGLKSFLIVAVADDVLECVVFVLRYSRLVCVLVTFYEC